MSALGRTALLAALGCNQIYGIERTELVDAAVIEVVDVDEDGVLDVIDVCPAIPNPLQEDMDGDRIGDVCDPCPTGSNHNEDGDTLLDGCDNCPQAANDDQANADGDDLGDACDPNAADLDVRERFDGFEILADDWIPGAVEWAVDNDTVRMASTPDPNDFGLWNRRIEVEGERWSIEMRVRFDPPVVDNDYAAIQSRRSIGTPEYLCYVQNVDGTSWIFGGQSSTPVAINIVDNSVTMRMHYTGTDVLCDANGLVVPNVAVVVTSRTHPGLTANTTKARFEYVDSVSTPP